MIDVSDPQGPWVASWAHIGDEVIDVAVSGIESDPYAYAAVGPGLRIIDFADMQDPRVVGSVDTPGSAEEVALSGSHAFVATTDDYPWTDSGLWVIDVADPWNPRFRGGLQFGPYSYIRSVAVSGDFAYVTGGGLDVIDVSNPESLRIMGHLGIGGADVAVQDGIAYVARGGGMWSREIQVVDCVNPTDPRMVGNANPPSFKRLAVMGSRLFAACFTGLQILPAHCEPSSDAPVIAGAAADLQMRTAPNPSRGPTSIRIEISREGPVHVSVLDLGGRRVRELLNELQSPGRKEILWDGRDDAGHEVPVGVYFTRVRTAEGSTTRRVVVVR
jgi:hypothetical protein